MIKNKHSLVDLARYGTEARKNIHSSVLIGDQRTKCPTFKEGDVLDANATLNLILDTYDGSKIFLTFSKEGQLIAERLDHIEQTSDDNNAEIVDMIESVDDKLSAQTQGIRDDVDIIQRQIPGLKRVIDIRLVSDSNGKKTYLVEKQDGDFAYIEIRDGEKGEPFVYNDFTQEQLDQLKVKGDKGDKGDRGVSIVDIKQSQISYSDRGINKLLITLDDGTVTEFLILNGTGIQNARQELDLIHDSIVAQERADRQLQQNIDALTATHQQDLQDIQNNITRLVESLINGAPAALDTLGEIANRLADDSDAISSIVSSIADETSARQSEDAAINSRISQLDLNHQNDISSVIDSVQDELTRASNAENILQLNISNLADIVSTNKTSLENAISEESTRAQDAEALLSQDISELSDVVDSKETAINTSISNLADTVSANKTDIEQALASEVNRAQLAEQANASDISSLSSTVETNRQTAAQAVSAEETRARSAEKKVADDLSAYIASNNTALLTEYTRASNAETALDTKIDNEAYLRSSKDTDLLNQINTITGTTLSGYVPKIPSSPRSPEYEASLTSYNKVWVDPNGLVVEGNNPITLAGHGITDAYTKTEIENKISNLTNDAQVKRSEMGVANGVATLDPNGLVPSSQLPSYVDDVLEYQSLSSFPSTGETGKIYVDTSTNLTYRWSGSTYTEISQSLALGETTSTAYAGNKGKAVRDDFDSHNNDTTRHITSTERNAWNAKYDKPSTGIPSTDMSSAVQNSLNLANSALLSHLSAATIAANLTALGYALTDTNTWRPITNDYIGSDQGTSLSLYGANALYNALVNGYASSAGYADSAGNADTVDGYHLLWTDKWGPSDSYTFQNAGLRIQQTNDESSGIQFNGDYINLWSPCDSNYSLRYFDEDGGNEVWNINASGYFSGSAASANYANSAGDADTVDGLHVHGGRNYEANKIVRTDDNGYIQAGWINTTSGGFNYGGIDRVYCSEDDYIRYLSVPEFKSRAQILSTTGGTITGDINLNNENAKITFGSLDTSPITSYTAPPLGSNGVGIYSRYGGSSDEGALIITEDTCVIYNSADTGWNFQVMDNDIGTNMTNDATRSFGVNQDHQAYSLGGFVKSGSDNSYVLLGGGGHKAVSDFITTSDISSQSVNYANSAGYASSAGSAGSASSASSATQATNLTPENTAHYFRDPDSSSWRGGMFWGSAGSEAMSFVVANPNTKFQFVGGSDIANWGSSTWQSAVPYMDISASGTLLQNYNSWLTPARLQLMRNDTSAYTDRACIGVTDGNLHLDSYPSHDIYLNYYSGNATVHIGDYTAIHSGNIGSQSVNYASSAGNADTVDSQHFTYSNTDNNPTYLWGTNSYGSSILAHRGSMSVNYANSAGTANHLATGATGTSPIFYGGATVYENLEVKFSGSTNPRFSLTPASTGGPAVIDYKMSDGLTSDMQLQFNTNSAGQKYFGIWDVNCRNMLSCSPGTSGAQCTVYIGAGTSSISYNSSYKMYVYGQASSDGWISRSDIRLKDVIEDKVLTAEDIANAPAFSYKWKNKESDDNIHVGTSALYWKEVLPEAVIENDDEDKTLSMAYGQTALLSTISLAKEVVTLKNKIEELTSIIEELKAKLEK